MITIPPDHKHAKEAAEAQAMMEKAGLDPASIALFVSLILQGVPIVNAIIKMIKHKA